MRSIAITVAVLIISACSQAAEKKHLFILSGQSNMYHMKSGTFHKRGAAIRNWDKEYKWPEGQAVPQGRKKPGKKEVTREEFIQRFGQLYDVLIDSVKNFSNEVLCGWLYT